MIDDSDVDAVDESESEEVYELEPPVTADDDPEEILQEAIKAVESSSGEGAAVEIVEGSQESELEELRERYLRTLADFENFRKRSERQRKESQRYATTEPLRAFLSVVDNLGRALGAEGSHEDLKAGVEMIQRQTVEMLRRFGVESVGAEGEPFDPTVHEAVMRYEDPDVREQIVTSELQKGYMLYDRLLRPAMVKVAVPAESGEGSGDDS